MRVAILTEASSKYGALLFRPLLLAHPDWEFLFVMRSANSQASPLRQLAKTLSIQHEIGGLGFAMGRSLEGVLFRMRQIANRALCKEVTEQKYPRVIETAKTAQGEMLFTSNVHSPDTLKRINDFKPDCILLCYLMQIVKESIWKLPTTACLNTHPSLLPKHAGLNSSYFSLASGDREHGVTVHMVNDCVDGGQILAQHSFAIPEHCTPDWLSEESARAGGNALLSAVDSLENGDPRFLDQHLDQRTYNRNIDSSVIANMRKHGHRPHRILR